MFKVVATEPFVVVLPSDHNLASHEVINPQDIVGETFIAVSNTAPVARVVIDDYLRRSGIDIRPDHEADHMVACPRAGKLSQRRKTEPSHYSITRSARCRSDWGMVNPRIFAVLRLMTRSNFSGRSIGSSAGLAPCKIFPTYSPHRRNASRKLGP